jgi:Big-like domain-containing protein/fibronectin type III domain protein
MSRLAIAVLVAAALLGVVRAGAARADVGVRDFSYTDVNGVQTPTEDKPQSKLWFQDGSWWGLLYSTVEHATVIERLDASTQTWVDTGTVVDSRPTARGDVLWDGQKLYVVSGTPVISEFSSPPDPAAVSAGSAELSRFSYDPLSRTYGRDLGFPVTVHSGSTESITLAKDSTGRLWVTYTQVAPDNSSKVYVNHSSGGDAIWGTPYAIPAASASVHYDDISTIVAYQNDKIGVMWSNQLARKFYLAVHKDGAADDSWQTEVAYGGGVGGCSTGCANDHLNVKQLSSDGSGRLFAAVKTANRNTGQAFVSLLVRNQSGSWSTYPFGAVEDLHTRPMVLLDEEHREVFMVAVSPEVGGTIYYKKSGIDNISFPPGLGTPFIQSAVDTDVSNPTTTKQNLNSATGLLVLADANTHHRYWHRLMDLSGEAAPPPAAPTSLAVSVPSTDADSTLRLTWSDNSNNESSFAIERKTTTASYSQVATVGANVTSYTDTGLTAGGTFTYRVRAINSIGASLYSEEASATTAQTGPVRTFTAVEDTYVDSGVPTTNFGAKTLLSLDTTSPTQESYLKFNVSGLVGTTVASAKLRLYVSDNASVKGGSVARMSDTSWQERTVTYNTRPAIDGAALSSLGAVNLATWYDLDVTPAVRGDGTLSLGLKTASTDAVHYASREDAAHAPQLVVTVTQGDTTPPQTTIATGPSGTVTTASATFAFSADEQGSTFACSLDGAPFAACTSPQQYSGLADGAHTFDVRATDPVGNTDATPAHLAWTVDTIPPSTLANPSVAPVTNSSSVSFALTSDESNVTFECRLDGSAYSSCTSPKQYSGLADGDHTFTARATDAAGNTEPDPSPFSWTVDTNAPETTIDAGPQGAATTSSATFRFSSSEAGSTFACRLDGAAFAACTSPKDYTGLADGSHAFEVRASDAAGNVDLTPSSRTWVVNTSVPDTTPPTATLTAPAADVQAVHGTVTLQADAADDVGVDHVEFLVDGAVVATDATAPYSVSWNSVTVTDGPVTITARAIDTSSNATTSTGRTVTVDNASADTAIDSGPQGPTGSRTASFAFSSTDTAATFECSLDASSFASCASPQQYAALTDGPHTFAVRARDAVGNVDASPATRNWTVDTVAPQTSISAGPTGTVNSRTATLTFAADEAGSTFECRLDGSAYSTCTSPKQYTGVADGAHSFDVRATDAASNVDATPATQAWTVDPVVFRDGFETGDFSQWTLPVHAAGGGSVVVQSAVAKTGASAAKISAPASTDYAYVRKTLSASQTDLSVAGDFQITTEGASGQEVSIFKLYDSASTRLVYLNRRNVSGRIYVVYNGTTFPTTAKLALGTWAKLKVRTITAGATSTIEVTMDGVSIYNTTTASLGTSGIRTLQIGNDKQLPFALYADNIEALLP